MTECTREAVALDALLCGAIRFSIRAGGDPKSGQPRSRRRHCPICVVGVLAASFGPPLFWPWRRWPGPCSAHPASRSCRRRRANPSMSRDPRSPWPMPVTILLWAWPSAPFPSRSMGSTGPRGSRLDLCRRAIPSRQKTPWWRGPSPSKPPSRTWPVDTPTQASPLSYTPSSRRSCPPRGAPATR